MSEESTMNKIKIKIKEFWYQNRDEIIDSVTNTKQSEKQGKKKKTEIEEKMKRERKAIKLPLILGVVYVLIGAVSLWHLKQNNLFTVKPQKAVIGFELIILGIYALLYTFIFYCVQGRWRDKRLVKNIKAILILFMLPYHLCIKGIKAFIKESRQEHVMHTFPYYLISLLIVMLSFILIGHIISGLKISEVYKEFICFIIVWILIIEFFVFGKIFAYFSTKSIIKSVQKAEVKSNSKINWRNALKSDDHKKDRLEKFEREWETVKKELEYTKIYFYIVLTALVLWIPKEDGALTTVLVNQFLGITTIAALAREVKGKKENDDIEGM